MRDGKNHISGTMYDQERKTAKVLIRGDQWSYFWQYASAHQHCTSNEFRLGKRNTGAHDGTLTETHQVNLFWINAINRDSLFEKSNQRFTASFCLFRINDWSLRSEIGIKPGITSWSQSIRRAYTDDQKSLV